MDYMASPPSAAASKRKNTPLENPEASLSGQGGISGLWLLAGVAAIVAVAACMVTLFAVYLPLRGYLSESPWPIETVEPDSAREAAVLARLREFARNPSSDTLRLEEPELNLLLHRHPLFREWGWVYRLRVRDSLLNLRCSVPARRLAARFGPLARFLGLKGWVNAELECGLLLQNGTLTWIPLRSGMGGRAAHFGVLGSRVHTDCKTYFPHSLEYDRLVSRLQWGGFRRGGLELVLRAPRGP